MTRKQVWDAETQADLRDLGQVIRIRRKMLGLSQEKLGLRAGVDRQTINRAENAAHALLLPRLKFIAEVLGWTLVELFLAVEEYQRAEKHHAKPRPRKADDA